MGEGEKAMDYKDSDQMIVSASHRIKDSDVVYVGVGLPMVAALLAKHTHAPNCTIIIQNGIVQTTTFQLPAATDTLGSQYMADHLDGLFYINCLGQAGYISAGFIGAGQVNRYGNVNATVVGDYTRPTHRWPGSGGGNDVMSFCNRTIIILRQSRQRFPEKVDFVTCPGYLDGKEGRREQAGLLANTGPSAVITNFGCYEFEDREMVLKSVHGHIGVTLEQVKTEVGWDIRVSPKLEDSMPPTPEELRILREKVDPDRIWVGGKRAMLQNE